MKLVRSTQQIDLLTDACIEAQDTCTTEFANLTYEEGVLASVRWLTDLSEDHPLSVEGIRPSEIEEDDEENDDGDDDWENGDWD